MGLVDSMKKNLNALKGEIRTIQKTYESVIRQVNKDISKAETKGWGFVKEEHLTRTMPKLEFLKQKGTFPRSPEDLERVDVAIKSKILKAELKQKFPNVPFEVRTQRYSGGSSINVHWKDAVAVEKVNPIVKKYSKDLGSDSQSDYYNVDNYASASREISHFEDKLRKLKSKGLSEDDAFHKLHATNFPITSIANLKKQIKEGLKGGTK
jgi:hypothetical protein